MPTQKDPTIFGYQNFYSTTLTGDITSGTLTIGLATVPSPTSGILIIEPDSTSAREVILYTSKGASTITCPSDGRGWSGSSASAHLTGSTVIMASVDEYFEGLADGTLSTDPIRTAVISNHVVSGGIVAQSAGLVGTFSNIVFYLNGQRYSGSSIANKTYTASKDTYVDVTAASGGAVSVTYTEVANGAASPALAANNIRVAKVVTSGAAITSVTQKGGNDTLGNVIYPQGPFSNLLLTNPYKFHAAETNGMAVGSGTTVIFNSELYDTGNNYSTSTGLFTAPVTGFYRFSANLMYINLAAQVFWGNFCKNGTVIQRFSRGTGTDVWGVHGTITLLLTAGDTVSVQSSIIGTTRNLEGGWSYFTGELVSLS